MLLNYLKLAIRLQLRNPFFTLINLLGLSVGFAAFIVLWQYSYSELNSDKQWKHWERIARMAFWWEWTDDGKSWQGYFNGSNATDFAEIIHIEYPQIEAFTRIIHQVAFDVNHTGLTPNITVRCEGPGQPNIMFREEGLTCADPNFFEFFSIPLRYGHASTVLLKANAVVISEWTAGRYFADGNPLGQTLQINNREYEVTGVFENLPRNTHLLFDMVVSNASYLDYWEVSRPFAIATCYIKAAENLDWIDFENEFNQPEVYAGHWAVGLKAYPDGKGRTIVQPLNEVAFNRWNGNHFTAKSKPLLIIFQFVGWTIRGIALFNQNHIVESLTPERLLVRIDPVNFSGTIDEIQSEFNILFPGNVFTWRSLDDSIANQYYTEKLWRNQILFFTGLAVALSCLGLLGVIANKVVRKTKEVGIRIVLGAGLHQIAYLLAGSTLRQVAIASIVGIPVAHYLIDQYLQKFTERMPLEWWNYAVPLIMLAAIMAATIGSLVLKAARGNPIEALKHE